MNARNTEIPYYLPVQEARASASNGVRHSLAGRARLATGNEMRVDAAGQHGRELQQVSAEGGQAAPEASARPTKRRLSEAAVGGDDLSPAKRTQTAQADTGQHGVEGGETAEQVVHQETTILHHPTPIHPERPPAPFLESFTDPAHPYGPPGLVPRAVRSAPELGASEATYRAEHCRSDSHLHGPYIPLASEDDHVHSNADSHAESHNAGDDNAASDTTQTPGDEEEEEDDDGDDAYVLATHPAPQPSQGQVHVIDLGADTAEHAPQQMEAPWTFHWFFGKPLPRDIQEAVRIITSGLDATSSARALRKAERGCEVLRRLSQPRPGGPDIAQYFRLSLFPVSEPGDAVVRTDRHSTHLGPNMWYGYARDAFPPAQASFVNNEIGWEPGSEVMGYPFLLVELADAPALSAGLAGPVARCFEYAAPLTKMVSRLSRLVARWGTHRNWPVNGGVFMLAMSNTSARLYVAWYRGDNVINLSFVHDFDLQDRRGYLLLRRYIKRIILWGRHVRLQDFRCALNELEYASRWRQWLGDITAANLQRPRVVVAHG